MKKLLVDTNILLDLLARRVPHYNEAAELFSLADRKKVTLAVSSLSMVNAHYILRKQKSESEGRKILRNLKILVRVLPLDDRICTLALNSDFSDFEDAIQHHSAIEHGQEIIITRNLSDYKASTLPVMTARDFIHSGLVK
ncbi:MAG: PIN domain-containing protein [Bacteroidales bacterium]|nr:PIN domain-containing protein [Bacteroidales bacterium]